MVTKNHVEGAGGIRFTKPESQVAPPFAGREEEEEFKQPLPPREGMPAEERLKAGKVPLHPAMVRLPLRMEGIILSEWLGWEGFLYDEASLNDLAEMGAQLGIELNPMMQFVVAMVSIHLIKFGGYYGWVKRGKPKPHKAGEEKEEEE